MSKENVFTVSLYSGNSFLDTSSIQTAGQFITLHQIVRPLTQLNKQGEIEGQLVKEWRIKDDHKTFSFTISDDAKWSDGSPIKSEDVKKTIERQINLNTSNHFNFAIINEVKTVDDKNFIIKLKERNQNFIRQVSYPEFGIIYTTNGKDISLAKSSGAYVLSNSGEDFFELKKNIYFPSHSPSSPSIVRIEWGDSSDKIKKAKEGSLDFFVPFSDIDNNSLRELLKSDYQETLPHVGYSFWLTINPNSDKLSELKTRRRIQSAIKSNRPKLDHLAPFWEESHQLYLPDGLGRPTDKEITKIWKEIEAPTLRKDEQKKIELSILIDEDFPFISDLEKTLSQIGFKLAIDKCLNGQDFFIKIKSKKYDLIQTRNDFSSIDLHENLQTTFNPENPLIITDQEDDLFQKELQIALNAKDSESRHNIYKEIAKKVLLKGYIAPIAYHKVVFIHKKEVDITTWSTLFPEISIWKVRIQK